MTVSKPDNDTPPVSRRSFLKTSAAAGLGAAIGGTVLGQTGTPSQNQAPAAGRPSPKPEDLKIALIGAGEQGRVLMESCLRIPGIRIAAICDIWSYSQQYARGYLRKYGQDPVVYEDYRELLAKEKGLAAALVATPDWLHAEHADACLESGLHVYCEKEMSNSLEKARTMVETARRMGRLLQIGHQRRSNPRYRHAIDRLIREKKLLGRVNLAYAQWNRSKADLLGWPKTYPIDPSKLQAFGYNNMTEFRNWRWYKKFGGGPIVDLGSHQIDLFSWVFGCNPATVFASGGTDYYKGREWFDNVMAVYEFETPEGTARAMYQVQTTTKYGGFYEVFMGDDGAIQISEVAQRGNWALREAHAPEWDSLIKEGLLLSEAPVIQKVDTKNIFVDVRVTAEAGRWPFPVDLAKPAHQPHLENFFDAVRRGTALTCPASLAYESAVAVLKVNDAVRTKSLVRFRPGDFKA
ncbi:MAG: Gfo/Idh/MocA family oxidoreductase [Candidatus Aminicenantes bacterium]|nr:Gfo/Idh/MocA family oxidoreductase [Candidatus Aminicenantes bacterium]